MGIAGAIIPDLRAYLAADPGVVVEAAAREFGVTCRAVVEALPLELRKIAMGPHFVEAMGDIASWGDITVIVHTEDGIMEFSGPVPAGAVGRAITI